MVIQISKTKNVSAMISWPRMVKSKMAMVLTGAESLINETAWPVRGGKEYAEWPGAAQSTGRFDRCSARL